MTHPQQAAPNATVAERGNQQPGGYGQYGHYYRGQKVGLGEFKSTTSGGRTQLAQ